MLKRVLVCLVMIMMGIIYIQYDFMRWNWGFISQRQEISDYYDNGKILAKWQMVDGVPQGEWIEYDETGEVIARGSVKDGALHGLVERYHKSGRKMHEANYEHGQAEGFEKFYHKNGALEGQGSVRNGKREGEWHWYFDTGVLKTIDMYKNGGLNGPFKQYTMQGDLVVEGEYRNGQMHGIRKQYYPSTGHLVYTAEYDSGRLASPYQCYDNVAGSKGYLCPDPVAQDEYDYSDEIYQQASDAYKLYHAGKYINEYNGGYYVDPFPDVAGYEFWSDGQTAKFDRDSNGHFETIFKIRDGQLEFVETIDGKGGVKKRNK